MVKRMVIWSTIGVLAIAAGMYVLFQRIAGQGGDPFDAVSATAAVVLEWHKPEIEVPALMQDSLWPVLGNYELVQQAAARYMELDTLYKSGKASGPLVIVVHRTGAETFSTCAITRAGHEPETAVMRDAGFVSRQFRGTTLWEGRGATICWYRGLLFRSPESGLVEQAVSAVRGDVEVPKGQAFRAVREAAARNSRPKLYLNMDALPQLLAVALGTEGLALAGQLADFSEWMVVEYAPADEGLFLTGTAATSPKRKGHLARLMEMPAGGKDITEVLPYNTAVYYAIKSANSDMLLHDMAPAVKQLHEQHFINWVGPRAAMAIVEPFSGQYEADLVLVLEASDPEQALVSLGRLSGANGEAAGVENFRGFPIFTLQGVKGLEQVAGFRSALINDPYATLIDEMVVCAPTLAILKVLVERYLEQQTLSKDMDYLAFRKRMTEDPSVNIYVNTARCMPVLKRMANAGFGEYLEAGQEQFQALNPIGMQFNPYRNNIYLLTGLVQMGQRFQASTSLLWKADLDTVMLGSPVQVTNHNDNTREVLVQDAAYNLYLVDRSGRVLWKYKLDAPIVGEVYQVDYYRNGKYQWLFSTQGAIYLVDRLGRNVENFPLQAVAPIIGGLALIDYDRSGDFRMFIGCANGSIYGYYKSGRPLPGWRPKRNTGNVHHPLFHFVAGPRDYLIAHNEDGILTGYARDGQVRFGPVSLGGSFLQPFVVEHTEGRSFTLLNADTRGRLVRVNDRGQVAVDSLFEAISDVAYRFEDLDGNGSRDHIFLDKYRLIAFNQKKEKLMEYELAGLGPYDWFTVEFEQELLIGLVDASNERIYLVRPNGSLFPDFPLRGRNPFLLTSLLRRGEKLVVTGLGDRTVTTYRLK